jgi:hypothetical protein
MTSATFAGCDCCGTWLLFTRVRCAPIFFAMSSCSAGGIMWSAVAARYHEGLVFHAATGSFCSNDLPRIGPCVAVITAVAEAGRSCAKCLLMPSLVSDRKPEASATMCAKPGAGG